MYGHEKDAMNEQEKRGLEVYLGRGRCVSCHTISQTHAIFTDNKFHNIGVGFKALDGKLFDVASEYSHMLAKSKKNANHITSADELILASKRFSELGRYAISKEGDEVSAFKTQSLRNIEKTAPYMHDGSIKTLKEVVQWYNFGGRLTKDAPVTPFLDGGIRPLNLSDKQIDDLVAFMKALTSPKFEKVKD